MSTKSPAERAAAVRAGRAKVAAEGGRLGGRPPYGWTPVPSASLVEVPEEQSVIWLIGHLRRSGWSQRRIAEQLTAMGIPTPNGGRVWLHAVVAAVLERSGVSRPVRAGEVEAATG